MASIARIVPEKQISSPKYPQISRRSGQYRSLPQIFKEHAQGLPEHRFILNQRRIFCEIDRSHDSAISHQLKLMGFPA